MYDKNKILAGLIIFLILVTFPFWFNLGKAYEAPELQLPEDEENCIRETEWMRAEHMQLLDDWRDEAVRNKKRVFVAPSGKKYTASLQNTCMDCHESKEKFCDRCHDTTSVSPYCWDCHIAPKEDS
jgi:hypothetical protein